MPGYHLFVILVIVIWNLFVIWNLGFVIFISLNNKSRCPKIFSNSEAFKKILENLTRI
jgi:hypothetical protein